MNRELIAKPFPVSLLEIERTDKKLCLAMKASFLPCNSALLHLTPSNGGRFGCFLAIALFAFVSSAVCAPVSEKLRIIIETDAGGDPDDEQSLVRFLLYANEWDVEGIIANRQSARERENKNPERTGLGIVRRQLNSYSECFPKLVQHDRHYPTRDYLWQRTVAGYDDTDDGVKLILAAVDAP